MATRMSSHTAPLLHCWCGSTLYRHGDRHSAAQTLGDGPAVRLPRHTPAVGRAPAPASRGRQGARRGGVGQGGRQHTARACEVAPGVWPCPGAGRGRVLSPGPALDQPSQGAPPLAWRQVRRAFYLCRSWALTRAMSGPDMRPGLHPSGRVRGGVHSLSGVSTNTKLVM